MGVYYKIHIKFKNKMGMTRIRLYIGIVVVSLVVIIMPILYIPSGSKRPDNKSFLRLTLRSEPPTLDWSIATDGVSFEVITNIMEGLTEYDQNLRPRPAIAERWEVSGDGKRYTFYLRSDVRWTDGKPVTAGDFVYSWRRLLDPKTGAEYAYFLYDLVNAYEYNSGAIKDPELVGIRARSDYILDVNLKKPIVYFPSITTFMVTFPLRQDILKRYGDRWTEPGNIQTNGPFKLSEWRHEYRLTLVTNNNYYLGRPKVDQVSMFVINELSTALTLYETGDIDMVNLQPEAIPFYSKNKEYINLPLLRGYYYGFNVKKRPFDDVKVRRAFSMAVDRNELPNILKGGEIPSSSWIPKGMFGYNPDIGFKFDPEGARRLLAEAGYPDGKGLPTTILVYDTNPVNNLIAENIQAQWKRNLNIDVELDNQEWKVFLRRLKTDTPAIFRLGWGADYPDPDNFMNLFTTNSGNNNTGWGNRRYDGLVASASTERDEAKRLALYNEAQRILVEEDTPIMPLFITSQNLLIKPYVKDLDINAMELLYLKGARIE